MEMENGSSRVPVLDFMNNDICANLLSGESSKQLNLQTFKSLVGFLVVFQLFRSGDQITTALDSPYLKC